VFRVRRLFPVFSGGLSAGFMRRFLGGFAGVLLLFVSNFFCSTFTDEVFMSDVVQNMPAAEILSRLAEVGITQAGIQRDLGLKSPASVYGVIHGFTTSHKIRGHIAACLSLTVRDIWPLNYDEAMTPPRRGRRLTRGLYGPDAALITKKAG
jgi:lambda repressor-like predicted transcriptional regulator